MPTLKSVMDTLKSKGNEKTRATYVRHGMPASHVFGVSIADLKLIAKTIKGNQILALELYATGNMDAMYLAGMVAKGAAMSQAELQSWAEGADSMPMIANHTVPWVTIENEAARTLATKWMTSKNENIAAAGWHTFSGLIAITPDTALDLKEIESLMTRVVKDVHTAKNRERAAMNAFVIAVGTYVAPLLTKAKAAAAKMGDVSIDVGDTACRVRVASEAIARIEASGKVGVKKKTIRC